MFILVLEAEIICGGITLLMMALQVGRHGGEDDNGDKDDDDDDI